MSSSAYATSQRAMYTTTPGSAMPMAMQYQQAASSSVLSPGQTYMVSDAALYHPVGCEYIAPGRNLRSGMTPLYSTSAVRTYEASPIFSADRSPIHRTRSVSSSDDTVVQDPVVKTNKKKNFLCC